MARFTGIAGTSGGNSSALNFVQNKVAQPVSVTGYPTTIAAVTITTTGKPVQISLTGEGSNAQAGAWVKLNIFRDGEAIGNTIQIEASAVSENVPYAINVIDEVGSGQHVYEAIITAMSAGNWSFGEVSGPIMNAVELTGFKGDTGETGPQGEQGEAGVAGQSGDTADFSFLESTMSTDGNMSIEVNGVPGDITLSAYNGVALSFAQTEGAGLRFPDDTIQTTAYTGGGTANLVVPTAIKDESDADFITFERTGTGTARIATPQDDLSLRSARDITLYAGDDGPGNVYIGWGDAVYTPDSLNRVATIGDIQSATGLGDFQFNAGTATVNDDETLVIQANNADTVKSQLVLDPNNGIAKLQAFDNPNVVGFYASNPDWDSATWAIEPGIGSVINFTNAQNILNWIGSSSLSVYDASMVINGVPAGTVNGFSYNGTDVTLFINNTVPTEDPTVNEIGFAFVTSSFIDINYDNGSIDIEANNMDINISSDDDVTITAGGDDLRLYAYDDVRFIANYNNSNNNGTEQNWRMNSEGQFEFPGTGYIENVIDGSGDGNGYDTFKIVPDDDLVSGNGSDQYLIIDPTSPNHIHIRAGGTPDASTADLFLGGEKNKVQISDQYNQVQISTEQGVTINEYQNLNTEISTQFIISLASPVDYGYTVNVNGNFYNIDAVNYDTPEVGLKTLTANGATFDPNGWYEFTYQPDGTHNWTFTQSGLLLGPAQGFLNVTGFVTPESYDLSLNADASVVLSGNNGEFLNDPNVAGNQIATITDVANYSPVETSFTVNGGSLGNMPTFNGAPLFSGTYVKIGPQVHFQIQVDMDNITSFGTGQYYVDLPFDAKYGYQFKEGCLHDISTSNQFAIGGHVTAGTNRLFLTYTGSNGQDEMFTHSSPVGLNAADNFHISGTYISQ